MAGTRPKPDHDIRELLLALQNDFRKQLFKYWLRGEFTDFEIKCHNPGGEVTVYKVHKLIVCSTSLYFRQLLEADMELKHTTPTTSVTLNGVNRKVLQTLLNFVYSGDLQLNGLTYDELREIPLEAQNLGIYSVGNAYVSGLCKSVNISSLPVLMKLQSRLQEKELEEAICDCIVAHLPEFPTSVNTALTRDQLQEVLGKASKVGTAPDILLQTSIAWVNHKPEERRKDMEGLLLRIHFEILPKDFLRFLMEDEVIMKQFPSLLQRLSELMLPGRCYSPGSIPYGFRKCKSDTNLVRTSCPPPRKRMKRGSSLSIRARPAECRSSPGPLVRVPKFKEVGYVIIGRDESNKASIIFCKLVGNIWSGIEDLGQSLDRRQAIAYYDDRVYFIGGEDINGYKSDRCEMYDLITKELKRLPDLRIKRLFPVVAVYHNVVYVAGGLGRFDNKPMSHMEVLNGPLAPNWKNAASLRVRRNDEASWCIFENRIYVVGGGTNKCECFDPRRQTWELVASLPEKFNDLKVVTAATSYRLYAFHYYKPTCVYWLDTEARRWRDQPTKGNGPEWVLLAVGVANKVFILDKSRYIFIYEAICNYWHPVRKLPRSMSHPAIMAPVNPFLLQEEEED